MFSVLLFGTSGVVLDFGRVYSEHSNMQSYTDQAALAAAAELDRSPDSISRAIDAVFGGLDAEGNDIDSPLTKTAVFSSGADNQFNISHLVFLSDLANDAGAQSSMTGIQEDIVYVAFADGGSNGNEAEAAAEANYVIAVAEERSVSNTLIGLINTGAETAAASSNIVRTVAAARRQISYCGEFSNLVMCSPRTALAPANPTAASESNLGDFMSHFRGARFAHIADNNGGSEQHRLYRRRNPILGANDDGGLVSLAGVEAICNTLNTIPGGSTALSDEQLDRYHAICHLAAAQPRDHCIGETLEIVAAEPEVITTALNVAFNMWDAPINEVIDVWPSNGLASSMPLFQPDLLTFKGKVWDPVLGNRNATNSLFGLGNNHASRLHYSSYDYPGENGGLGTASSAAFDLILPDCLRSSSTQALCGTNGLSLPGYAPFIGFPATLTALSEFYQTNYPIHFQNVAGGSVPGNINSFYEMYLEERAGWSHAAQEISSTTLNPIFFTLETTVHAAAGEPLTLVDDSDPGGTIVYEDASLANRTPSPELQLQIPDFFDTNNVGYPAGLVNPDDTTTRRRFSVPLVDCGNFGAPNADGIIEANILEFVDMYLMQPPSPECGLGGGDQCNNANITKATIFTEFVGTSVYQENEFPELVR